MDIVTLGAALNGSAEYVNSHFKGGSNIQIVDNPDGTQTINASGEVSSEDAVARAEIAAIKDGETLDSFGDVETALGDKADTSTTYTKTEVDTALGLKQDTISDLSTIRSGAALGATAVQPETGKGLSTNDYTTAEKTKLDGIAEGAEVNVQSNWTQTTTTADDYIKNKPTLGTAAAKNATDTYNATGTDVTTGKAVAAALATLPKPMVFKGSLGTGGTITTLPTASSSNKGYVYKVITAGTYASQSAKVGDTFISDGSVWVLIPSGDEPSGTVTNVAVANGGGLTVSGSPITSSGTITVGHSNSVTAKTSSSLKKITYDANGHITGSSELSTAESNALASGIDSTKVAQISTNQTNIGKVQTQANWNTNNGVKNLSQYNNGTDNSPIKIPCNFKNGESYIVSWSSITSTSSAESSRIAFMSGDNVVSNIYFAAHGVAGSTTLTLTADCDSLWLYAGSAYEIGKTVTANNFMIRPATISDSTFQPYSLPNTKITPELIELVDNGAKNLFLPTAESKTNPSGFTGTITNNGDGSYTINGTAGSSPYYLKLGTINLKAGTYVLYARPTQESSFYVYNDGAWTDSDVNNNRYATFATDTTQNIYLRVSSNATVSNYTIYPMVCSKAAWDVSQKFVPYRPSYEETVEQVATNKNNILLLERMNGAKNLAPYSSESHSSTGFFFIHSNCIDIAAGEQVYLVYDYTQTAGQISIQLTDGNGNIISGTASYSTAGTTEGHKATKITIPTGYTAKGYNANQGSAGNVSISNFMIVSADIYEAGFTDYQPYCMTNAEITAWILSQS